MTWRCEICSATWEAIPDDAVILNRPGRSHHRVYRFADGTIHSIRKVKSAQTVHRTWHKASKKIGCEFCFPPPEPPVQVELLQEVVDVALSELPEPPQPEPEIELETEEESTTTMAAAFRRFKS